MKILGREVTKITINLFSVVFLFAALLLVAFDKVDIWTVLLIVLATSRFELRLTNIP